MSMAVNKKEFVEGYLDDCVRHACHRVDRVWYSIEIKQNPLHPEQQVKDEKVTLVYAGGEERDIPVTGCNNLAIMKAVMDVLAEELI